MNLSILLWAQFLTDKRVIPKQCCKNMCCKGWGTEVIQIFDRDIRKGQRTGNTVKMASSIEWVCKKPALMHGCAILVFFVYCKEKEHWMQRAYPPGRQQWKTSSLSTPATNPRPPPALFPSAGESMIKAEMSLCRNPRLWIFLSLCLAKIPSFAVGI